MQKAIETNNAAKGMDLQNGKRHYDSNGNPLGGIKAKVINSDNQQIEVEMGEVVITRDAVSNPKKYKIEGTTKEILSTLNQEGGGVPINETEAEILNKYKTGGKIPREKQIYLGKEGGSNVSEKGAFEIAVDMENEGIDSETIRSITGWFRNPFDKLWRFEISDENMEIIFDFDSEKLVELESFNNPKLAYKTPLKKVIIHNELFKAYPSIKDLEICFIFDKNSDVASLNVDSNNNVTININLYGNRFRVLPSLPRLNRGADFKAVITHELQHVIQVREGLSGGSSVKQEYKKLLSSLPTDEPTRMEVGSSREDFLWGLARRNYLNSLGEIESRDSQERVYFDKKTRIEIPPYSLINFNNEEVIVVPETKIEFRDGGKIPREKQIYLGKEGGSNVSPKGMFEEAVDMEKLGFQNEEIRKKTGWFRSELDDLWRYEISDKDMEVKIDLKNPKLVYLKNLDNPKIGFNTALSEIVEHKELFKAYPKIKDLKVSLYFSDGNSIASVFIDNFGKINIKLNLNSYEREIFNNGRTYRESDDSDSDDRRKTNIFRQILCHELQHCIQINEGLSAGTNFDVQLEKVQLENFGNEKLSEEEQKRIAKKRFDNSSGEIEAISSAVRINLDELQRKLRKPYSEIAIEPKYFSSDLETKIKFNEGGELIKRADGSYSRRGLYDNIRDNVGSGRKPTKQMLEQEAKIKEKYHLGGDMSKHLAPNGKPSKLNHEQWHLVREPEFKAWFGDFELAYETGNYDNVSKVIDEETKEPLVVYHGTSKEFTVFGKDKNKSILPEYKEEYSYKEKTHYFHKSKKYAKTFGSKYGGYEKSYFLNIKNIEKVDEDTIEDIGYFKNIYDYYVTVEEVDGVFSESGQYATLLSPNQIKLADGSNTTFDANNDDIRYADGGSIPEQGTLYTKDKKTKLEYIKNGSDYVFSVFEAEENPVEGYNRNQYKRHNKNKATMNYNQFVDFLHSESYLHDKFKQGGSISKMTSSELKAFYNSKEGKKLDAQTYAEWKRLVNMSKSELENFYNSKEGREAGLSQSEAKEQGIDSGRESARWIVKMKDIPYTQWTSNMWRWAKKQINFIKRMSGMKGELYDDNGNKTRKHTALLIWGHNPEEKFKGGGVISQKALAVETTDLKDYVRKYFVKDGRIDVSDAMQELFGNKRGKSIADEYRKRIGLHKKGGLTISELAHKLWEEHKDEVRGNIDDSDFREAVEDVISSEYGVTAMIKSLMEKSDEGIEDEEAKFWANQFDENEYNSDDEQLTDEEMSMIFRDMEQAERELAKGTEHEMEHLDTLKKVAEHKITPKEAVVETSLTHIAENKNYYEDLAKMEKESEEKSEKELWEMPFNEFLSKVKLSDNSSFGKKEVIVSLVRKDYVEDISTIKNSNNENTEDEYNKLQLEKFHQQEVLSALRSGKPVPTEVVNFYSTPKSILFRNYEGTTISREFPNYSLSSNLAKMEKENEVSNIDNLMSIMDSKIKYQGYSLKELYDEVISMQGSRDGALIFSEFIKRKKDEGDTKIMDEFNKTSFVENINPIKEQEESIPNLIEGLKVLADSLEGAEKKEIEDVIEGLEILLESDDKYAEGGEFRMKKGGNIVFKPITIPL